MLSIKKKPIVTALCLLLKDESQALQELQGCKAIVIRPADKGSAVVIQNHSDYRKEVMRQLEDAKFYKHLDKEPTASNNATIREAVKTLRNQGVINDKTAADLVETKAKCPHFYTLPKIHKNAEAPPGRPIVSSIRAPTERISANLWISCWSLWWSPCHLTSRTWRTFWLSRSHFLVLSRQTACSSQWMWLVCIRTFHTGTDWKRVSLLWIGEILVIRPQHLL